MKQPNNSIERFANKLTWKQRLSFYSIAALVFAIFLAYCCKMMLFTIVSCIILLLLFALTCILAYTALLSSAYSIIKNAEYWENFSKESKNKIDVFLKKSS